MNLNLTAKDTSKTEAKRIIVQDKYLNLIATIYCDSSTIFHTKAEIYAQELENINTIKKNFFLFWNNIKKS